MRRSLRCDTGGVAMIEFALTLPILLAMGLGGLEVANYGIACLRISQIAMTTADNAGRVRAQISESDINEVMTGARFVGNPIDFAAHGRVILSSLETRASDPGKQWIRWQRCSGAKAATSTYGTPKNASGSTIGDATEWYNASGTENAAAAKSNETTSIPTDGTNQTPTTGMGVAGKQIIAAPGTAVMVVEVVYDYQPIVGDRWIGEHSISSLRAYNVRQRTDQIVKTGGVAYGDRSRCNKFSAT